MQSRKDLERARELLGEDPAYTCAFVRGKEQFTSAQRGVAPLLALADEGKTLEGFSCADRVVGRAAALLYAFLGAKEVYGEVLSASAEEIFKAQKIAYGYGVFTQSIVNRQGTGPCPMEEATEGIFEPLKGLCAIRVRLRAMRTGQNGQGAKS